MRRRTTKWSKAPRLIAGTGRNANSNDSFHKTTSRIETDLAGLRAIWLECVSGAEQCPRDFLPDHALDFVAAELHPIAPITVCQLQ